MPQLPDLTWITWIRAEFVIMYGAAPIVSLWSLGVWALRRWGVTSRAT